MVRDASPWNLTAVGKLGRIVTGKTPPTKRTEYFGDNYPFITPTDIDQYSRTVETQRSLSEEGRQYLRNYLLPPRAICFVCIGATIGKICMTKTPSFSNQQINTVIADEANHDPRFVYYLLRHNADYIKAIAGGAATPIINKSAFSRVELTVPPFPTQRKIAAILSAYDDLIENNLRRIKILEEMARLIYREWFVNFRFPGHENVKMIDSPLGRIPEGWEIKKTKEVVKRLKAGNTYTMNDVEEIGEVIVVDQSRNEYLGFHSNEADHKASPDKPIIIFGDHTCKMQLMVEPFSVGPNVVPFVAVNNLSIYYVFFLVKDLVSTQEYKRHWTELSNKQVAVSLTGITKQFANLVIPMFEDIETLRRKNINLSCTRDLLLPKLISRELDVSELDIDIGEEPA